MFATVPTFKAHPLLPGGNLQTIGGYVLSQPKRLPADDVMWVAVDESDKVALDCNFPSTTDPKGVVLLMHGLGGCGESPYILRLARRFLDQEWITIRLNHRGCGRHPFRPQGLYHSGSFGDLHLVMHELTKRWPKLAVVPIGFSLSSTILLNLLGQRSAACADMKNWPYSIAVCPPVDLEQSSKRIADLTNWHYDQFFNFLLLRHVKKKYPEIFADVCAEKGQRPRSLRTFDELITAPFAWFQDRSDYYRRCSPRFVVSQISKPTAVIAAADDPLVPAETIQSAAFSHAVDLYMQPSGGHMGFVAAKPTQHGDWRWLDDVLVQMTAQQVGLS
jgi:hypothetical protein